MKRMATILCLAGWLSGCGTGLDSLPSLSLGGARSDSDAGQAQTLYLDLIKGLQQRGLHRAALAHLDEFDRLHGRHPQASLLRAESLAQVGEDAAAWTAFQGLLRGPQAAAARHGLGLLAGRGERWPEAVTEFNAALALEPTSTRILNNLGYALLRSGDMTAAEFRLRQAAELEPGNGGVRNNLALLLAATNRNAEAERLLGTAGNAPLRLALREEVARITPRQEPRK